MVLWAGTAPWRLAGPPPPPPLSSVPAAVRLPGLGSLGCRARRQHVFQRQPEQPAAAGGAAEAGGGDGEDQGLSGSRRTSAVLYAERLQRCPANRNSCWE